MLPRLHFRIRSIFETLPYTTELSLKPMLTCHSYAVNLPVIDLSHVVKGASELRQAKQRNTDEEANGVHPSLAQRLKFWKKS